MSQQNGTMLARERSRRAGLLIVPLGLLARILLLQGKPADARVAIAELFDACRVAEWEGLRDFAGLLVQLALVEKRYVAAARLIGFADKAWRHLGRLTRFSREMRAIACTTLGEQMDAPTLERLVAEGELMDEEATIVLALAAGDDIACV